MANRCVHHPGREATVRIGGKYYCARCAEGQKKAAKLVDRHVVPKECFVWYRGSDRWAPIHGTGCAHWVAHQKNISGGSASNRCLEGKSIRVFDIKRGRSQITDLSNVKVGDIYVTPSGDHCGLVSRVVATQDGPPRIEIQHDSSHQGRVVRNDFATHFHGKGQFFR